MAPVFDLERLLRTCLKEDRSRVARDNLDLVAYWPPTDKSCRPKCRRFQNDRDLGKNWEDLLERVCWRLAQAALGPGQIPYRRGIDGSIDKKIAREATCAEIQRRWQPRVRIVTPARWRSKKLGAITAASSRTRRTGAARWIDVVEAAEGLSN